MRNGIDLSRFVLSPSLIFIVLSMLFGQFASGQAILALPSNPEQKESVLRASDWLAEHVYHGSIIFEEKKLHISIIAWKDPTLLGEKSNLLAGYAITDTLWASYAMSITRPEISQDLHHSLEKIDCLTNSLHEVIWQPLARIHHKPADSDPVHGRSVGRIAVGGEVVDVRSFSMAEDPNFTVGHPLLFAEHAAYQSLFEFRNDEKKEAIARIHRIFDPNSSLSDSHIRWDGTNRLLVDYVNEEEYQRFVAGSTKSCRQYSFKLATLLYASRLLGLENEYSSQLAEIQQQLLRAQLSSGGIAHFFDVGPESNFVIPCPDATGEATSIFMLATMVKPDVPRK